MIRRVFCCPKCRKVSHNPNDAEHRFCGMCKVFVDVVPEWSMRGWTIFFHPLDFPLHFVVREWRNRVDRPETEHLPEAFLADTLEEARGAVPPHMHRLNRDPKDDSKIVEVWI